MVLNLFIDTIRLSEVYRFEEFSNQNKNNRIVSNDLAAVICSDLKISLKIIRNLYSSLPNELLMLQH